MSPTDHIGQFSTGQAGSDNFGQPLGPACHRLRCRKEHSVALHRSPWQGVFFFERLLSCTVQALSQKAIGRRLLSLTEIQRLLPEVEAAVNTRPLTFVNQDPETPTCLTKTHFLPSSHSVSLLSLPDFTDRSNTTDKPPFMPSPATADRI